MNRFLKLAYSVILSAVLMSGGVIGCAGSAGGASGGASSRPAKLSAEDNTRLTEAQDAAISAEKKLSELRTERKMLEAQNGGSGEAAPEAQGAPEAEAVPSEEPMN